MFIESHYRIIPLLISYEESGDLVFIEEDEQYCRFSLIDGLGHGRNAHEASSRALRFMKKNHFTDPARLIAQIHPLLTETTGVVMAACVLHKQTGRMLYSGVGNITTRTIGSNSIGFIPRHGIVGANLPSLKNLQVYIKPGDIIIMYSDGIKERFEFLETPELHHESAKKITDTLIDKYFRGNDDASLLTVKVL